jgi:hypothetical protein
MAATDLTPKFVNSAKSVRFDSGAAVDAFFRERFRKGFVDWFNASIAGRGAWTVTFQGRTLPVMIGPPRGVTLDKLKERFTNFWDHAPELFGGPPTLVQFLSLMSIFINEVRGHLFSVTEAYGRPGHPGVAYLFDAIPGLKVSYNNPNPARPDNIAAGDLFHDPAFIAAHQARPLGAKLARTANRKAWNGADYALTGERASGPDVEAGFIAQADFMKFRGRGLIQTTWRSNYRKLVNFVARYEGKTPLLKDFAARWGGKDADRVLTESTNQEWDALFGDPALEVVRGDPPAQRRQCRLPDARGQCRGAQFHRAERCAVAPGQGRHLAYGPPHQRLRHLRAHLPRPRGRALQRAGQRRVKGD